MSTLGELRKQAASLQIRGRSKMKRAELEQAIASLRTSAETRPKCCLCNQHWELFPHHEGRCWPCIKKEREMGLENKCLRKHGLCQQPRNCLNCVQRSFYGQEKSLYWTRCNVIEPWEITRSDEYAQCVLTCHHCSHDFTTTARKVYSGHWCPYCSDPPKLLCSAQNCDTCQTKSFASDEHTKYWHPLLNHAITPRAIFLRARECRWFLCPDCNHPFEISPNNIGNGRWCPYCSRPPQKLCTVDDCSVCQEKSFASVERSRYWHPRRNGNIQPRDFTRKSEACHWFLCPDCNHDFERRIYEVTIGRWCPYCSRPPQLLCDNIKCDHCFTNSFEPSDQSKHWHKTRNGYITPRQVFRRSGIPRWFICQSCKQDFSLSPDNIASSCWCPHCDNSTEMLLFQWLCTIIIAVKGARFDWCLNPATGYHLPFDIYIPSLNIIIELDGPQHFLQISNWRSPLENQQLDLFKMTRATEHGITVIRLLQEEVRNNIYDWQTVIRDLLVHYNTPSLVLIATDDIYHRHGYNKN